MKEWGSPYNPFNSMKILMWKDHLEACAKGHYLIPTMVDIDPSPHCNFKCPHCNAYNIIDSKKKNLSEGHWLKLVDFLSNWGEEENQEGIKSVCISGGGEPLMNKGTPAILERCQDRNLEVGLITNGSLINQNNLDIITKTCRWVGFSMDAATSITYNKLKGLKGDSFYKVCENLRNLAKRVKELGVNNGICFKFLLSPDNYTEIYDAVLLAKNLGVQDFHLRPVGYLGIETLKNKKLEYTPEMLSSIDKQMEEAFKLGTSNFHVYGIRHKFTPDFLPKKNFSKCWCIPMLPTFGADGNVYYCFDIRGRKDTIMCTHFPDVTEIARFWNSDKHKKMINSFDVNSCTRCTFQTYNEVVEQVFLKDNMYRNFL